MSSLLRNRREAYAAAEVELLLPPAPTLEVEASAVVPA